jgi:hypothetical protein
VTANVPDQVIMTLKIGQYFYDKHDDLDSFREQLRQRNRQIAELRDERDEQADLIGRFSEYEEDYRATLESYRETFSMELIDDNCWTWKPFWIEHNKLIDEYNALVRIWNRAVPDLNAGMRDVGRPLVDLAHAVDAEVLIEDAPDLDLQRSILPGARRQPGGIPPLGNMGVIGRGGDRQHLADRLDPMRPTMIVDEGDHGLNRRSSSAIAK